MKQIKCQTIQVAKEMSHKIYETGNILDRKQSGDAF